MCLSLLLVVLVLQLLCLLYSVAVVNAVANVIGAMDAFAVPMHGQQYQLMVQLLVAAARRCW